MHVFTASPARKIHTPMRNLPSNVKAAIKANTPYAAIAL
jgi:hypothetical protein